MALRATFVVDPDGVIRFAAVNELSVGHNPAELLRVLDALQTDELCPCNWNRGEQVLRPGAWGGAEMSIETLKNRLPDYAKDIRLNLGSLAGEPSLAAEQHAETFIASDLASRNADVTAAVLAEFAPLLSAGALEAAKAAAAIMAMNNVQYRFTHLIGGDCPNVPAKLRMNVMARPGVDKATFELWSLAVSAVNGLQHVHGKP